VTSDTVPEALRRTVSSDLRPVKPLSPVWQRWLVVVVVATVVCAAALAIFPVRSDLAEIPLWLSWGCSFLELGMGLVLVCLALREAVPGNSPPGGAAMLFVGSGVVLQVLVGLATWMHSQGMPLTGDGLARGMGCLQHDSAMALPVFAVTLWLVFRALPMRAPMAGLLGGAGAAIGADAVLHLLCPFSAPGHVLVWHTGAIALFAAGGWMVGKAWESLRWRERT